MADTRLTETDAREGMTVYYGVVRENRVILDDGVELADDTRVEVRPQPSGVASTAYMDEQAREALFKQRLRESGLLGQEPPADPVPIDTDRRPIHVEGQPLSEMIIAERR